METGYLFALGAAITWGLTYAIDQELLSGINPLALLIINTAITAILLSPLVYFQGDAIRQGLTAGTNRTALIVFAVVINTLANLMILYGISALNASKASIIEISYPFFVVLFSYLLFGSTLNNYFFIGGLLMFTGAAIIINFS